MEVCKVILCPGKLKRNVSQGTAACGEKPKKTKAGAGSWARLVRRVFSVDVSTCPRCGAELDIVSVVTDASSHIYQ